MNLHEYQSKSIFSKYGIPVPTGEVVKEPHDISGVLEKLGSDGWVVKAQVHAGGRGKVGGVRLITGRDELESTIDDLLGSTLKTHQTGAEGLPVNALLIENLTEIQHEYYLSLLVDRSSRKVTIMASAEGGVDIEAVAVQTPEKIHTETVNPTIGLMPYQTRKLGFALGLDKAQVRVFGNILHNLYMMFIEQDASLVEINPLVLTTGNNLLALDAKINLDENALYRHPDLLELRDITQEDPHEAEAKQHDLNYIKLNGSIGCMVNGAGLAMATMDLIKLHGGEPANFLDVGGGATAARVTEAFKLILSDPNVKAVLVNIFGGIVRCDLIAEGIINAVEEVKIQIPVVVRLEGTNVEQGRKRLAESGLDIISAEGLTDAAEKVVAAAAR